MSISHHLSTEKPDQMVCNSDHEHHDLHGCSHSRSYTCSFCKRGFANAQALGGHMNIHRRDRAKLKQLASDHENFLSLDSTNPIINPIHPPPPQATDQASEDKAMFLLESSEEGSGTPTKLPRSSWIIGDDCDSSRNKDSQELIQQLPSSVDAKLDTKGNEDKKMQLSNGSPQEGLDVDLELRLGPEPHESLTRSRTRQFF